MSSYWYRENSERSESYRKDGRAEGVLAAMNRTLAELEPDNWSGIQRPTIFVFGLPRSGTTLLPQLLANVLDLGYVDNLIARFWLAPCQGIELSRAVFGDRPGNSFESDLGRSDNVRGPHEFSYFWQRWMQIDSEEDLLAFGEPRQDVDWEAVGRVVGTMQDTFGRGIMFKTNYAGQFASRFARTFTMPLFVYIERNPVDVALSILDARSRYYDDPKHWWATYPPEYRLLADRDVPDQIAGQVVGLRAAYDDQLARVPAGSVVRIGYQELCDDPAGVVDTVRERLRERYGIDCALVGDVPDRFGFRRRRPNGDLDAMVARATIERMGGGT